MVQVLFLTAIVILSQAGLLIRMADASPLAICFWRLLIASLLLFPLFWFKSGYREIRALPLKQKGRLLLASLFLFTHLYFFFKAVQQTSIGAATLLFCLNPISTALLAWYFWREGASRRHFVAAAFGLASVVVLFWESLGEISEIKGLTAGLLSGILFSCYMMAGKSVRSTLSNTAFALSAYAFTAVASGFLMWSSDIPFLNYSGTTWIAFGLLAILPTLLGHAIFSYCLNHLNVNLMSCATLLEPILAAFTAAWIFSEPITTHFILSLSLAALSLAALFSKELLLLKKKGADMIRLQRVPTLKDNLSYIIQSDETGEAWVIDPGEASPIITAIGENGILRAILNTHHHHDHVGGNLELKKKYGASVFCSQHDLERVPGADHGLTENDILHFEDSGDRIALSILNIPGHTQGQIAFFEPQRGWLFVGDTLFAMGCGRLFEGTAEQMWSSLKKIKKLPAETHLYFGHEYTKNNSLFSEAIDPERKGSYQARRQAIEKQLAHQPTAEPPTLREEREVNLFLNADRATVKALVGGPQTTDLECFTELRKRRDGWTAPDISSRF